MKPICVIALFVALAGPLAHGETFIGPTTSTNRLLVPTNSAIIITSTFGDFTNSTQVHLGMAGLHSYRVISRLWRTERCTPWQDPES